MFWDWSQHEKPSLPLFRLAVLLVVLVIASFLSGSPSSAYADGVCTVTNLDDSGPGSLREAINCANSNVGPDTIIFDVTGTINVLTQLPTLSDTSGGTLIDGSTAPGYSGAPIIALTGPGSTSAVNGIKIISSDNEVRALQIGFFKFGIEITGAAATDNSIVGSYIGNDGTSVMPNRNSIFIKDGANNTIGGTLPGDRNIISGHTNSGVVIIGGSINIVQGNYIGTDVTGYMALGTSGGSGVAIENSGNNLIGGTMPEARNIISNGARGVNIDSSSQNVVQGNYIGTDVSGTGH